MSKPSRATEVVVIFSTSNRTAGAIVAKAVKALAFVGRRLGYTLDDGAAGGDQGS